MVSVSQYLQPPTPLTITFLLLPYPLHFYLKRNGESVSRQLLTYNGNIRKEGSPCFYLTTNLEAHFKLIRSVDGRPILKDMSVSSILGISGKVDCVKRY